MKKIFMLMMVLTMFCLLVACGKERNKKETKKTIEDPVKVTIILKEDGKEFDKKQVKIQKGTSLQAAMEMNYKVDMDKEFICGIDGHMQDKPANKYWLYDVNGKQAEVMATKYRLKDGDVVVFKLMKL